MDVLLKSYVIGSIGGIINELTISEIDGKKHHCFHDSCWINMLIFNVYGWGLMMVTLMWMSLSNKISLYVFVIISIIFLMIFECIAGQISYQYWGKQTWNYQSDMCNGYISWLTTFYFTAVSILFVTYVYPLL